ncbi:MAG: ABC transporter permease [Lachnospiraceae bacterium]
MSKRWRSFKAEFSKYLLEVSCYYPDQIVGIVVLFIMFFGFFSLSSGGTKDASYYIGFVFWFYANGIIATSSVSISDEKQMGTFEQLLIKPTGLSTILFYRSICWLILQTIEIVAIMLIIKVVFRVPMAFSLGIIPVFLVTMLGLVGISYILSALTLLFTKTASFGSIFSYVLLFFTGVISGTNTTENFGYYVLPLAQGIRLSRDVVTKQLISVPSILFLILNSALYLIAGVLIFYFVMRKAKSKGISQKY